MTARVLVVDDSAMARRALKRILEPEGFEVIEAEDGLVALERYALERPDVVMLDLVMKGMYGLEVLNKLRQLDPGADAGAVAGLAALRGGTHAGAFGRGRGAAPGRSAPR